MTREEAIKFWEFRYENAKDFSDPHWEAQERREHREYVEALRMAIEALQAKTDGDLISRADAIEAMGEEPPIWQDTAEEWAERDAWVLHVSALKALPSAVCDDCIWTVCNYNKVDWDTPSAEAEPKTDDENELKFYYVESLDDYWVGRRLDNFYYATWHKGLGFVWSHSRYLPWGEHIVDENTLWKEHTYPSEPIEIPFTEWIVGFVKKYSAEPKTGKWVKIIDEETPNLTKWHYECDQCGAGRWEEGQRYCQNCGARMEHKEER